MRTKPAPMPCIDLGGKVQVIDESGAVPKWKTIGRCFATKANAEKILRAAGLRSGWLCDSLGYKTYITI